MGDTKAFITLEREGPRRRPVAERLHDWNEVYLPMAESSLRAQASRCMDCGIPFCHAGCPLGNLIPDWNDLVYRNRWRDAIIQLHATNNFPEFTGRLCPAPCEEACVLNINANPVTIKAVEQTIIDHAFAEGWVIAEPPQVRTGKTVAVVGSGPAGLACAQQLNRAGHTVTVLEKDDRLGGLLRYGIPDFKMDKSLIDRRLAQMREEGVVFCTGITVGVDISAADLRTRYDAIVLATGALNPRSLDVPGSDLSSVLFAMDYLTQQNRTVAGDTVPNFVTAQGKHVIIVGGGDTGADCFGTALRQGALSVTQFQIHPEPPKERPELNPWWPEPAMILKSGPAHEEGGERAWGIHTTHLSGDEHGQVKALHAVQVQGVERGAGGERRIVPVPGSDVVYPADLVLIAIGYSGPFPEGLLTDLGLNFDRRGNVATEGGDYQTHQSGVFAAGDTRRGQSLIVWAIAEGREAAHSVDTYLMGTSRLPLTAYK